MRKFCKSFGNDSLQILRELLGKPKRNSSLLDLAKPLQIPRQILRFLSPRRNVAQNFFQSRPVPLGGSGRPRTVFDELEADFDFNSANSSVRLSTSLGEAPTSACATVNHKTGRAGVTSNTKAAASRRVFTFINLSVECNLSTEGKHRMENIYKRQ